MKHAGWIALLVIGAIGCSSPPPGGPGGSASAVPSSSVASSASPVAPPPPPGVLTVREGGALLRSPSEAALWLADEDHGVVRRIAIEAPIAELPPLPEPSKERKQITGHAFPGPADKAPDVDVHAVAFPMPGKPAQVLPLGDRVLVSVRDPGLLLVLGNDGAELFRVSVPDDAWGLAVSADARVAYVTSAWTHRVTAVDLATKAVTWSLDVAREPRGIAASADGRALYVSHLVGAALTKIAEPGSASPTATRVALPPDPLGTFLGVTSTASLGYAALLGPDGRRLYVARHALGATGRNAWQGVPSVDVLYLPTDTPVLPRREPGLRGSATLQDLQTVFWRDAAGLLAVEWIAELVQPRALAYLRKTDQLLVAAEGTASLVALDALSVAPSLEAVRVYALGARAPLEPTQIQLRPRCGAPTGVAVDAAERVAWVFCRTTNNVVAVRLEPEGKPDRAPDSWREDPPPWGPFAFARLADDPDPGEVALGRRLFYDAEEPVVSGGLACAGCHPEGRDDGFTWHELSEGHYANGRPAFVATPTILFEDSKPDAKPGAVRGYPRQTPMLAGRVDAAGPYGWHAESATLDARIRVGFTLHRIWTHDTDGQTMRQRADPLAAFVRRGLTPPPEPKRELSAAEQRGREVFGSPAAGCAKCHVPASGYTDRSVMPLPQPRAEAAFEDEKNHGFKVPSLRFVGGTPPYFHDGRFATLTELIEKNEDRMGKTQHLSADDRAALVAFLGTL